MKCKYIKKLCFTLAFTCKQNFKIKLPVYAEFTEIKKKENNSNHRDYSK